MLYNENKELQRLYVDADFMMVGSIEMLGNLINDGLQPVFAHRKKSNNHWTFAFRTNDELKTVLTKYSTKYDIVYKEGEYGEEQNKISEDGVGELRDVDKAAPEVQSEA